MNHYKNFPDELNGEINSSNHVISDLSKKILGLIQFYDI